MKYSKRGRGKSPEGAGKKTTAAPQHWRFSPPLVASGEDTGRGFCDGALGIFHCPLLERGSQSNSKEVGKGRRVDDDRLLPNVYEGFVRTKPRQCLWSLRRGGGAQGGAGKIVNCINNKYDLAGKGCKGSREKHIVVKQTIVQLVSQEAARGHPREKGEKDYYQLFLPQACLAPC